MKRGKKAQQIFGMSFGVIFSIIIIIFIIVFGFIVIDKFLESKDCTLQGLFIEDLEESVTNIWRSQGEYVFPTESGSVLSTNIELICFVDFAKERDTQTEDVTTGKPKITEEIIQEINFYEGEDGNMVFYPTGDACEMPVYNLKHIDLEKITAEENPYCIPVEDGKLSIKIKKDNTSPLVILSRITEE